MDDNNGVINLFDNNSRSINEDNSIYSELLKKFVKPFEHRFSSDYSFEDVLNFGMNAWNMALMKSVIPEEEADAFTENEDLSEPESTILKQMIRSKENNFQKYEQFMMDLSLEKTKGKDILHVVTQDKETFINAMIMSSGTEFQQEFEAEEFEEGYINRTVILVKPTAVFGNWLDSLYPGESNLNNEEESNSYLVNEDDDEAHDWLTENYDRIFTKELFEWHTFEADWPQKRTFKMFKEWFDYEISTMVYDFVEAPVTKGDSSSEEFF